MKTKYAAAMVFSVAGLVGVFAGCTEQKELQVTPDLTERTHLPGQSVEEQFGPSGSMGVPGGAETQPSNGSGRIGMFGASVVKEPDPSSPKCTPNPAENATGESADPSGWSCPKNTSGAKMVLIPVEDGTPFCIDNREAVYGEYKQFLAAKGSDFSGQPAECEWNNDYGPASIVYEWACPDCAPIDYGPPIDAADPYRAVQGLDFCDAWAYCAWSGKRLCGLQGAERGKVTTVDFGIDANTGAMSDKAVINGLNNEWFNVCTQGGTTKYPYGDTKKPGACVDATKLAAEGDSSRSLEDLSCSECRGATPPYDRVYNMSGNVPVWLNICFPFICASIGGRDRNDVLSCDATGGTNALTDLYQGVRCCADAVQDISVRDLEQ